MKKWTGGFLIPGDCSEDDRLVGGVLGSDGKFYTFAEWAELQAAGLACKSMQIGSSNMVDKALKIGLNPLC